MKVEEFTGSPEEWNNFVAANGGNHFQSYEWGEFRRALDWQIRRLQVREGKNVLLAGLVMKRPLPAGASLYYAPEGPVVRKGNWNLKPNQRAFAAWHDYLKPLAKADRAVLLKIDPHRAADEFPVSWLTGLGFRDSLEDQQSAVVLHVDLQPDEEAILAQMKQKGRYNIRYAERKGVKIRSGQTAEDLDIFYRLHEETAKRQGITHRAQSYFEAFRRTFMEGSPIATFLIAEYQGEPVAATLVLFFGEEAIYLYGGSSERDRNTQATYLVQWEGMREAKRRGCRFYNMTGIAEEDDPNAAWAGLRQFKLKFGGEIVKLLGAYDYPYQPLRYHLFSQADRVRRRLIKRAGH
jgi:lipid II:glycine glycyltransferase (peptidoglycan interpeptide bridge formation enzyme)